jgi:zinc/manganese transport system permease protein
MLAEAAATGASWNPIVDINQMWSFSFMVNAFRAGTLVAVMAGTVGYFMVLRRQSFAGHTLASVAFPGAAGATLLGVNAGFGYLAACLGGAMVIATLPAGGAEGHAGEGGDAHASALTGVVLSFALACGLLFVALYHGLLSGVNGLLFGSFLGITDTQVRTLAVVAALTLAVLAVVGRRLLFASIDPRVAASRGVPTRLLGAAFLLLLGGAAAGASQITGVLLVFALLVMPAATAQALTTRPGRGLVISVALALVLTWLGLGVAYFLPYPVGFVVTMLAFAAFVAARLVATLRAGARLPWRMRRMPRMRRSAA